MSYLLDTHAVLWLAEDSPKLSEAAKQAIFDPAHAKFVSIVSAWELAIKISLGKIRLEGGVSEFFNIVESNGFSLLPLERGHVERAETLPFLHKDPFDRLLVCAALAEGLEIVSADSNIREYPAPCIW